jgi:hypothetical protein
MLITFTPPQFQSCLEHLIRYFRSATSSDAESNTATDQLELTLDHTSLDLYVIDEHTRARRPWIAVAVDTFSRRILEETHV